MLVLAVALLGPATSTLAAAATTPWELLCGFQKYNATMTRETFFGRFEGNQGETHSHPWGAAAIPATAQGIASVTPALPEYATPKIKPRLGGSTAGGGLQRLSLRMTVCGPIADNISVAANGTSSAMISYNMWASVWVPQEAGPSLTLDRKLVSTIKDGKHWCVEQVGCCSGGAEHVVMARAWKPDNQPPAAAAGAYTQCLTTTARDQQVRFKADDVAVDGAVDGEKQNAKHVPASTPFRGISP